MDNRPPSLHIARYPRARAPVIIGIAAKGGLQNVIAAQRHIGVSQKLPGFVDTRHSDIDQETC